MTARALLILVLAPACATEPAPSDGPHLPSDAYFTGVLSPYTTLDACMAVYSDPHQCAFELVLCRGGYAGEQRANTVVDGEYHLEGHHAVGLLDDMAFDIDVETGFADADNLGPETWIPDAGHLWQTPAFDLLGCL